MRLLLIGTTPRHVLNGLRQLILKSPADAPTTSQTDAAGTRANQEFVIVSHSLGSYLIFSALDMNQMTGNTATVEQTGNDLQQMLKRTSMVVFFANQLRLLELVGLDGPSERNIATHLEDWVKIRCEHLMS